MKKNITWLIQSNQITPIIYEFLQVLKNRIKPLLDLKFIVPETDQEIAAKIEKLEPQLVRLNTRTATHSKDAYQAKKQHLANGKFSDGLSFSDVLLLDDMGAGNVIQTSLELGNKGTCGIICQIPTPLGSSETEERFFHSAILWAKENRLAAIGYELLPLDTRWTLAPSLPNGVITKSCESHSHLKQTLGHSNIWMLPRYESAIFSPLSDIFDINGTKACYHYRNQYQIPHDRVIIYIPHNVAMVYEFQELLRLFQPEGKRIHLMFGTGKDQVRGQYSHKEVIEIVYQKELTCFASYSFHDLDDQWEIGMADCVTACSACYHTLLSQQKNIPTIIFDPTLPSLKNGAKQRVSTKKELSDALSVVMELHANTVELADILIQVAKTKDING